MYIKDFTSVTACCSSFSEESLPISRPKEEKSRKIRLGVTANIMKFNEGMKYNRTK